MSETKPKIIRKQAYKVNLSRGDAIQIDEEEVQKVVEGVNQGQVIIVKQGVINPSYFVSITRDGDRVELWLEDTKYDDIRRSSGIPALKPIFTKDSPIYQRLKEYHDRVALGGGNKLPELPEFSTPRIDNTGEGSTI